MTYLGFSDFETQVVPVRKEQDLFGSPTSRKADYHRIPQALGLGNIIYQFLFRLYNRNNKSISSDASLPDINYAELMRRYQKKPLPVSLARKYCLLDYVTENWILHASRFDPNTIESWSRFREFVFHKNLSFAFKPWDNLGGPSYLPHLSIYLWALENDHLPLLLLLRDIPGGCSLKPYLQYKTLCWERVPPPLSVANTEEIPTDFLKYREAYDWPAMTIFSKGRAEMLELFLQEDPSIISYRHIMISALQDANSVVVNCLLQAGVTLLGTEIDLANALHSASRKGNTALVKTLLEIGADANSRLLQEERGSTPLYEALLNVVPDNHDHGWPCIDPGCLYSTFDTIQLLLDHGADPNVKHISDETALHRAIGLDDAYVRLLLSMGADVEARNDRQQSVLDLAVEVSDRTIDILYEYGVNIEAKDDKGRTSLLRTVQNHPYDNSRVKRLVERGADVHAKDSAGKNVFHYVHSSSEGHVRQFLDLGADINARDRDGTTALGLAVRRNDSAKVELLLTFGAAFGDPSEQVLTEAAARGNKETVDILLRLHYEKSSALFSAVKFAAKDVVVALLEAGADPNFVDVSQITPLTKAIMKKDKEIARSLIQAGADVQPLGAAPCSPLYYAIASGQVHLVELLIQQGLDTSKVRPSETSNLRPNDIHMRSFLAKSGIPFKIHDDDDD